MEHILSCYITINNCDGSSLLHRTQLIKNTYHSGITIYKGDVFVLVKQLIETGKKNYLLIIITYFLPLLHLL